MAGRLQSHQLPSGLYVSGSLEPPKEKPPTITSRPIPYTGGDIKKSGELGRMFDISFSDPPPRVRSGSGPIRKTSGPLSQLQPTGLITSGPLNSSGLRTSGPLNSSGLRTSGPLNSSGSIGSSNHHLIRSSKPKYGSGVTVLNSGSVPVWFKLPKLVIWAVLIVSAMGLLVGAFLYVAVKKPVVIVAIAFAVLPAVAVFVWNCVWRRRGLLRFVESYPNAVLRGAVDGQFVKVTGVVTCGSIPLESSYQSIPRCVYVDTELYEYKGFSWGSKHAEKYVSDFYISDFQSGLRALVKAGYGSKVSPFVIPTTVADVTSKTKELSPSFLQWLADRNLPNEARAMRLKEGYIKEGSTVSVMGMVRRHDNVLMIIPPAESVATSCKWWRCLVPTYVEGLIVTCDENQNVDVIPV